MWNKSSRRTSAFSWVVSDLMTSGICLKIIQEERSGWGWIGMVLMVVGLCEGCLGFIGIFFCLFWYMFKILHNKMF